MKVVIDDMTNRELDWLSEMIAEKLEDLGHEDVEGFSFKVEVEVFFETLENSNAENG